MALLKKKKTQPADKATGEAATPHPVAEAIDLCLSLCKDTLPDPRSVEIVHRQVLKKLQTSKGERRFREFERAWVLKTAFQSILAVGKRLPRRLSAAEQLGLDASAGVDSRLGQFDVYFNRLHVEERVLLVLLEKYKFPMEEVAMIMGSPLGTLKLRRHQAMKSLREWIWEQQ
ncbi:MAG: RNA polymerase sigma factor [Bacteriovoracia bacterium]